MNRTRAVPHQNTVFRQLTKQLPWATIARLVAEHGADKGVRMLTTQDLLLSLLFAQISSAASLRDIESLLASQAARAYHSGLRAVPRSTLADAAAVRPVAVFTGVLSAMIGGVSRRLRQGVAGCVRLIDSTTMRLNRLSEDWSWFSADLCGVKAHLVYDPEADCPLYLAITPARVNDITAAKQMPIEAGATYVFDLGFYDYGWWAELDAASCRLVTRLKSNTRLRVIEELPLPAEAEHDGILADRIGFLPERMARSRRNPMQQAVREVTVRLETGKVLRIVSNDLDAPASEIAALYKRRWDIELFFRWIKQMLKIKHFYGTSENAVRIQIAVALIAFLLLRAAHGTQRAIDSLTTFARLVRANVLHRRRIDQLTRRGNELDHVPTHCSRQMALLWA